MERIFKVFKHKKICSNFWLLKWIIIFREKYNIHKGGKRVTKLIQFGYTIYGDNLILIRINYWRNPNLRKKIR